MELQLLNLEQSTTFEEDVPLDGLGATTFSVQPAKLKASTNDAFVPV